MATPHPRTPTVQRALPQGLGTGRCSSNPSSGGLGASQRGLALASVFPPVKWAPTPACPPLARLGGSSEVIRWQRLPQTGGAPRRRSVVVTWLLRTAFREFLSLPALV